MDCKKRTPTFRLSPSCAAVLFALGTQLVQANPMGGAVVSGQASFKTSGNTLTVSNTPGTIINWQNFSIQSNETTRFAQQSASSAVLNRVVTNSPSQILGSLQSNGRVFLVNPNGIVFGQGATVDVAGLVATTLNLSDADFRAGRHNYTPVAGAQNISNAGSIKAQQNGQIYLIAPNVDNSGVITAPNGEILLAAGSSVQLVNSLEPNLRVNITAPAGNATNVGQLVASAGSLGLFGTIVKNSGTVSADSAALQGGKIVFKASQLAQIGGNVSATGTSGGVIEALGKDVQVTAGGALNASGANGGGTVLVGGDAHGANPNVQNAQTTYVDATATIKADATQSGNGGKVVVWADKATQFSGNIFARGGVVSGNGGWVEVSGKQWLGYAGLVDTRAPHGMTGSLLLDPTDITISTGSSPTMTSSLSTVAPINTFTDILTTPSILNVGTLQLQLVSTAVIIDTTSQLGGVGNITVATPISWGNGNKLTLNATGLGSITINPGATITNTAAGGLDLITAGGNITLNAGVTLANGVFNATANGATSTIAINAPVNTGAGAINLTAGTAITEMGGITTSGLLTASGAMTFNGINNLGSLTSRTSTSVAAGTTTVSAAFISPVININGGTLNLNDLVGTSIPTLNVVGGVLGGTGAITIAPGGTFNWTGGTLSGTGPFSTSAAISVIPATLTTMNGTLNLARPFTNNGAMTMGNATMIVNGVTFTNAGTLSTAGTGINSVDASGPTVGTIKNNGIVTVAGNTLNWTAGQTASNTGQWFIGTVQTLGGILNLGEAVGAPPGTTQTYSVGGFNNYGTVNVNNGTNFITGPFNNFNTLQFSTGTNSYSGAYSEAQVSVLGPLPSIIFNSGTNTFNSTTVAPPPLLTLDVKGGFNTLSTPSSTFTNLSIGAGSALTCTGGITVTGAFTNNGTLNLAGATFNRAAGFINNGTLAGTGTITVGVGTAGLINQGIISPGGTGATGKLTITGDLQFATGSNLNMELGGTAAGQYDVLAVNGVVSGNAAASFGSLTLSKINGFTYTSVAGDTFQLLTAASIANTGTFAPFALARSNLTPTYAATNFSLVAAPMVLTVTANAGQSKVYGAVDPTLLFTATGFDTTTSDSALTALSGTLGRAAGPNVGAYAVVNQGGLVSPLGYAINIAPVNFSITPAILTAAIIGAPAKVYDGTTAATLTSANYQLTGFVPSEGATINQTTGIYNSKDVATANSVSATLATGNYTATGATLLSNYILPTSATGAASITPAPMTVTADALSKAFGTADPALTYTVSVLPTGDISANVLQGTLARSAGEVVGSYKVNQGSLALLSSNYTMNYVPCDFTIMASTLSPKVVQGITQVSLPLGMPTDAESDRKHVAQATVKLEAAADTGSAVAAQLPVCR